MIKIDIISGFLGAGKTTFLKKLLHSYKGEKIAILENEFGDIGIDGTILEREGYSLYEISAGCICCIMQDSFVKTLEQIIVDLSPDRIIIEPTGISILSDIVKILNGETFKSKCLINSLITIVDCENYLEQRDLFGEFFEDQIHHSTELLFSKIENVPKSKIEDIILSVREINQKAPIIVRDWNELTLEELYGYVNGDNILDYNMDLQIPKSRPCRENKFSTFAIQTKKKYSIEDTKKILKRMQSGEFGNILRGKGFLLSHDSKIEFSFTNNKLKVNFIDDDVSGKVCFIGLELKTEELTELWS